MDEEGDCKRKSTKLKTRVRHARDRHVEVEPECPLLRLHVFPVRQHQIYMGRGERVDPGMVIIFLVVVSMSEESG
jgi:hypothetical protein